MVSDKLDVVRAIYDAAARGEPAAALALMDPDIELHYLGVVPDLHGRTFHGHAGVAEALGTITQEFEDFESRAEEVVDGGGDKVVVVVHQHGRGRASGVWTERRVGQVWTVREGRGVRWEIYRDREEAMDAAAGSAG